MKLVLRFKDWDTRNILYFTVTSYKIGLWDSDISHCEGYRYEETILYDQKLFKVCSFHPHWWNCNTNVENSPLICINYDLTCDGLPHCAVPQVPNPDEDCDYHVSIYQLLIIKVKPINDVVCQVGMQEALQLIVYCLMTVFIVLLTAGCAKCCLRGLCPNRFRSWRSQSRRPSDVSKYFLF